MWALIYGGFILITGFLMFYWWTVVQRWAALLVNHVQPYRSDRMGGMLSPPRSPTRMMSPSRKN